MYTIIKVPIQFVIILSVVLKWNAFGYYLFITTGFPNWFIII